MGKQSRRGKGDPAIDFKPQLAVGSRYKINDRVTLIELKTSQYNGLHGTIVSSLGTVGRYGVRIDGMESKPIAVQAKNLLLHFALEDRVVLHGLSMTQYNGLVGTIKVLPGDDGRYGVLLDGETRPKSFKPQNLHFVNRLTTRQQQQERDRIHSKTSLSEDEYMNADKMAMMRMMMQPFMTKEMQIKLYGRKIEPMPDFVAEVMNVGLPAGVNRHWANDFLRLGFEQASSLPHTFEMTMRSEQYEPRPSDYMKRLSGNDPEKLKWFLEETEIGAIYPHRKAYPYSAFTRHSFSNQVYRKEVLHRGTTHVAIGFVDLGVLFSADLQPPPSKLKDGPLHFFGIEMSAYSVAKTHVLWELLKQAPENASKRRVHLRYVMQVWFSSTWDKGARNTVKRALAALLSPAKTYEASVREILEHWASSPTLSLQAARNAIADYTSNDRCFTGYLVRKQDRIAMAQYEITGDFGLERGPYHGNTIMFDCPDGTQPLDKNETVFSAFDFLDIVKEIEEDPHATVVSAAQELAFRGIEKLADWAQKDEVRLELICKPFQILLDEIASRKPWTMSWSNLPDYLDYAEFHRMALNCSIHGDTVHYGYSMNWVTDTFGTNLIDFARNNELAKIRGELIDTANKSLEAAYRILGLNKYLRVPPPTNPINTTSSFALEPGQFKKWGRHFFDIARRQGACTVANFELAPVKSPLSPTGSSTVAFTWSYDPAINFQAADPSSMIQDNSLFDD